MIRAFAWHAKETSAHRWAPQDPKARDSLPGSVQILPSADSSVMGVKEGRDVGPVVYSGRVGELSNRPFLTCFVQETENFLGNMWEHVEV